MSIKENARRALLLATTAAISTAFFTGCNKEQPSPIELDLDKVSSGESMSKGDNNSAISDEESISSGDESKDTAISDGNESGEDTTISDGNEIEESQGDEGADNVVSAISKEDISNENDNSTAAISEVDNDTVISKGDNSQDNDTAISEEDNDAAISDGDTDTPLADTTISNGNEDDSTATISKGDNSQENGTSLADTTSVSDGDSSTTAAPATPQPKWTETPTSGTMYINTDWTNARKEAIIGATSVRLYNINDAVNVVAKTNTDYYKLDDGSFIHSDYLSSTKVEIKQPEPAPAPTVTIPSSSGNTDNTGNGTGSGNGGGGNAGNNGGGNTGNTGSGTPYNGQTKVENGKSYTYLIGFGWIEEESGGGMTADHSDINALDGPIVGSMG